MRARKFRATKFRAGAPIGPRVHGAIALLLAFAAPAAAQAPGLPAEMIGIWSVDPSDCDDEDSDGRLIVEAKRVASFASVFWLGEVRREADGSYRADATRFDDGRRDRTRDSLELRLLSGNRLFVRASREGPMAYWRCGN